MDGTSASATNGPGKRGSALPRFGMSKLPGPGAPAGGIPKPALKSPPPGERSFASVPRPQASATPAHAPVSKFSTAGSGPPARPKAGSQSGFAIPHRPSQTNGHAPPSAYSRQALASMQASSGQHERQPSGTSTASSRSQYTRHNSLQSDNAADNLSSEESENTPETPVSPDSGGTFLKMPKRSRPSLSDRTMESLSTIPPSPVSERRRSSFFNPQSPMTPQRPPSSLEQRNTVSKINYGSVRGPKSTARPPSPTKARPPTSYTPGHVPKRSLSTNMPRPASAASNARPSSPSKPRSTVSGLPGGRQNGGRPMSMIGAPTSARPTSTPAPRPGLQPPASIANSGVRRPLSTAKPLNTGLRKRGQTPSSPSQDRKPQPASPRVGTPVESEAAETASHPSRTSTATTSSALRQQIAEAKAKARNAQRNTKPAEEDVQAGYNFENCADPFGPKPKDEKSELEKRIDDARRDGRLNISAMNHTAIPDEVLNMYESAAMEQSSVPWNETVDLVRLIAADNDISAIQETVFPDVSPADMADSEDSKGSQFGGLEHIDLHGNKLEKMPIGLRQLSRLTSINLSRNKLDGDIFNIVSSIPTLCELNLSNNSLEHDLPVTVGKLSLLEKLDVSYNKISSLPPSLRELTRLRTLSVSHNRLQGLPFDAIAKMSTLRELHASDNAFSGALIPSSVTELPNLKVFDVSNNACASLTFSKTLKLPALVRLDVSSNRLGMLKDISEWTNLTTLIADDNCLRELPPGMTKLTQKLRVVSVERNTISQIPEEVADMEALETLGITGNPIFDRKIVSLDAPGIKRVMMERRDLSAKMSGAAE